MTPNEALAIRAADTPDSTAFIAAGAAWTYRQLANASDVLACAFQKRGVTAGDRIALHMYNIPELVVSYCACFKTGAIAVPLNARFKSDELQKMLKRVKATLYIGQAELYESVASIGGDVIPTGRRFVVGLKVGESTAQPWDRLTDSVAGPAEAMVPDVDAPAALIATSGTTGESKLAVWTPRIFSTFSDTAIERGLRPDSILLLVYPMMHGSGVYSLVSCLLLGARFVLLPTFEPDAALDAIERHRCTVISGLPFMYAQLAQCQRARPRRLDSLVSCTVAGDVCPEVVEEAVGEVIGQPLLSFWAATEDVAAMGPGRTPGPFTRPISSTQLRVVDDVGQSVERGETGELLVRSPSTIPGYWLNPGQIDVMPEGWFHSGDLVCCAKDGQLRFMGRKKDLIIRGGSNISPVEVETVLRAHPAVTDAAVAGLPDRDLGQRVSGVVVLAEGADKSVVSNILAWVRPMLADYKIPECLIIVPSVPRNTLTKVDRRRVVEMIEDFRDHPSSR